MGTMKGVPIYYIIISLRFKKKKKKKKKKKSLQYIPLPTRN
jgi:hypothetical protein